MIRGALLVDGTGKNAEQWGITERGFLKPGFAADLCLFDLERVACQENQYVQDVPGDESRTTEVHGVSRRSS